MKVCYPNVPEFPKKTVQVRTPLFWPFFFFGVIVNNKCISNKLGAYGHRTGKKQDSGNKRQQIQTNGMEEFHNLNLQGNFSTRMNLSLIVKSHVISVIKHPEEILPKKLSPEQ